MANTEVPNKSLKPKAAATAAFASLTAVCSKALAFAPRPGARPAFCAAMAVKGLILSDKVPPGTKATATSEAFKSLGAAVASSI